MDEYGEDNQLWGRRCKNLHEELKKHHHPPNGSNDGSDDNADNDNGNDDSISYRENLQALLITSHVGKMANLECARMNAAATTAASETTGKGGFVSTSVESLTELIEWNQTRIEPYYSAMADIVNPLRVGEGTGGVSDAETSTTNTKDFVDELIQQSTVSSIDMDAFFHEYPHCQRTNDFDFDDGMESVSSSSSSSCSPSSVEAGSRTNKKKEKRKKRKKTKSMTVDQGRDHDHDHDHDGDGNIVTEAGITGSTYQSISTEPGKVKVSPTINAKVLAAAPPPVNIQSENVVNSANNSAAANKSHHKPMVIVGNGIDNGGATSSGGEGRGVNSVLQQQPRQDQQSLPLQNGQPSQYNKNNIAACTIDLASDSNPALKTNQHQPYDSGQIDSRQLTQQRSHSSFVQNPYNNMSRKRDTSTSNDVDFQQNRAQDNPFQTAKEFKASPDSQNDDYNHGRGGNHHHNHNPYQQRSHHNQQQQNGRGGHCGPSGNRNSSSYNAYGIDPPTDDYQQAHHRHNNNNNNNNNKYTPGYGEGSEPHFDYGGNGVGNSSPEIIGGGPYIPQSLQQPFKIPKRPGSSSGLKNNNNNKNSSSDRRPMMKQNGQITMKSNNSKSNNVNNNKNRGDRPSSSGSGGGGGSNNGHGAPKSSSQKHKSKNSGTADEDDEELPEELQHLEKDLVQKIKNEILDNGEAVTFDDIAGLCGAKKIISEVVCWPMKRPELFHGLRRVSNGLLLYGPPGTGKTLIGKAIAHESGATFFSISSSSLTSKWIGESEKLVRTMFAVAAYEEPSVVFIDEIDSLLTQRKASENEASRRIKTEFLVQLDGTGTAGQGRVLVIGATNRPQELDEAARRRFVNRLYIPLPNEADRKALIKIMVAKVDRHGLSESDLDRLAQKTDGYSGADLKNLCQDAAMVPMRLLIEELGGVEDVDENAVPPLVLKHFKTALKKNKPSVSPDDLLQYTEWTKLYGTINDSTSSQLSQDEDDDDDDW